MNRKALTLMEIIVSLTILSITMVGLLNVFISAKKHSLRNRSRVSASELAKYFLDPLQMQVRQDQWYPSCNSSNCLCTNGASGCPGNYSQSVGVSGNMTYVPNYSISDISGTTLKKVQLTINWTQH
ncbi:MAG: prepilin-type N-terminal cleavage/methylation domain-containing protein [Candidatus Omnitrophica bacterium]|nr:prepilin-type N-terminal cleavage/methylation domain-containing protein [Candidatus Omnitrophota bacterium]